MPLIVLKYFNLETETCGLVERGVGLYLLSPSHISILQKSEWHGGQKALLTETFFRAEGLRSIKNRHVSYVSLQRARGVVWPVGKLSDLEDWLDMPSPKVHG